MAFFVTPTSIDEGSRQITSARTFVLTRNSGSEVSAATYSITLQFNGTAEPGSDVGGFSAPFTMAAGQTAASFSIDIVEDTRAEPNETFGLSIYDQANPNIPVVSTTLVIRDDDATTLSVGDVLLAEGSIAGGTTPFTFTITRAGDASGTTTVDYTVVTGTSDAYFRSATAPAIADDFAGPLPSGTLTFAPGETTRTVTIPVLAESLVEGDESFSIQLSNAAGGFISRFSATAVIFNDESAGNVSVSSRSFEEGSAGTTVIRVGVVRPDSNVPFTVDYTTSNGSAVAGSDYVATSGRLSFDAYQRVAYIDVTVVGDTIVEPNENFFVTLSNATNGVAISGGPTAITIVDDDLRQTGTAGNDTLTGNTNGDTLVGGAGNDSYIVNNSGVTVVEAPGGGNDTVLTSVSYALPGSGVLVTGAEVETFATQNAAGTEAINLTGNLFSQSITGNNGDNIVNGGGGADTLVGLGGNDTFLVRGPGDVVIEGNGGGTDTVFTTVSYNLGVNEVEVLSTVTNADTTAIDLIGNFATQTVIGNYGNNVLNGGSGGLDTLIGLRGNDVYAVGDSRTIIVENSNEGDDTVVAAIDYTLAAGVSVEVLAAQDRGGTAPLTLRGNELAQTIAGNEGANILDGGGGNDVLIGGGGADSFRFTTALGAGNVDAITDFVAGSDRIGLAQSIFGIAAVNAVNFTSGTSATTADQRIVYNSGTGQLFFDADGSGATAAILFATLTPGTALTPASFEIV